jgi:hypothetical protein
MENYAGIEVSLESSSVCVMDASGRVVREAKVSRRARGIGSRTPPRRCQQQLGPLPEQECAAHVRVSYYSNTIMHFGL